MIVAVARPNETEESRVNDDQPYGAMPKLYGAPAYARPPATPVNPVERPIDPDDLPLEAVRSAEDDAASREGQSEVSPEGQSEAPSGVTSEAPSGVTSEGPSGVQGRAYESAVATETDPSGTTVPSGGPARVRGRPFRLRLPGRG
jgi:hypothetical protein